MTQQSCQSPLEATGLSELFQQDPDVAVAIKHELERQQNQIELIASENFTSPAVMAATGSVMTNKYAEGYPGRRYYGGCEFVDVAERLAIERACELFKCKFANVQPHSGSQANQAVFAALLTPGDTILGMDLNAGGHLTHGSKVNLSGKWFHATSYGVTKESGVIDMEDVSRVAHAEKPKLIIAGGSAYARDIDFAAFRKIADAVGAYLLVDMAHFAGLVAGDAFRNPLPHAHVVTTTTHKTIRGPRGGMILSNEEELFKKLNSAVFPGIQGGPLMHVIAAKAVAFKECLSQDFKSYAQQVVKNAKVLAATLQELGVDIVTGGTDCHLILVDLRKLGINGADAEKTLERAGMTCNKNGIPFDPLPPMKTSGIRLGTPAVTTRGFKENEFKQIGKWIYEVLTKAAAGDSSEFENSTKQRVTELCHKFPLYPNVMEGF